MKKRMLLILLAAVLSCSILFVSCDDDSGKEEPSTPQNVGLSQEAISHEIRDYFVLEGDVETVAYTGVTRIDGEVVESDTENNLLAVRNKDLDVKNRVIETVEVYDLNTGKVINKQSVKYDLYAKPEEKTTLTVEIDYPIIRVVRESLSEEGNPIYEASYYLAKEGSEEPIHSADNNTYEMTRLDNGLIACNMGGDVLWIDKDMEIVRTVDAVIANGYDVDTFDAEYEGYVYVWNTNSIQIFNRSGMCCATYEVPSDHNLNVHVLNNGNLLIQDLEIVDEYTACDFSLYTTRYTVTSYVMNFIDGAMQEVELDYYVGDIETAYVEDDSLPFELAKGRDNCAFIQRFANGALALYPELVVLNNALEIEYSLKNATPGVILESAFALNANYYVAFVNAGGSMRPYIFDLDGNKICAYANGFVNERFIVTENAIYDYSMKSVLDLENGEFVCRDVEVDEMSSNVFLSKYNFTTAQEEWYLFDGSANAPKLLADGEDVQFSTAVGGLYATVSENVYTVYAANGTELLVTYGFRGIELFDQIAVISAEFEGSPMTYVLK